MRVLLCSRAPLDPTLGTPKVLIELASELEKLGWRCRLASDVEICPPIRSYRGVRSTLAFGQALARFLEKHIHDFDVADFDQMFMPSSRGLLLRSSLLVARSALLQHNLAVTRIPRARGLRPTAGALLKGPLRAAELRFNIWQADRTFSHVDLINVNNEHDRRLLIARGVDAGKVVTIPLGLTSARLSAFAPSPQPPRAPPTVAFVGSFEARKGAYDFPRIVARVTATVPGCRFRFLGTRCAPERFRQWFPKQVVGSLEVVPSFEPSSLPELLRDCSVGIFPSHVEGFGLGVLEMLAASLPVVAYDSPGPPMMLPPEYLVPRGATDQLASKVADLLNDAGRLAAARLWARKRAHDFTWAKAAELTSDIYSTHFRTLRDRHGVSRCP